MTEHLNTTRSQGKKRYYSTAKETERVKLLTQEFITNIAEIATRDTYRFLFLDETGSNLHTQRDYGRSLQGEHIEVARPVSKGTNITTLGVMSWEGIVVTESFEGGLRKDRFCNFLENKLNEKLCKGDVIILDNARVHKAKEAAEVIKKHGIEVLFLPPYSPELNPIEMMWSKLKYYIRGATFTIAQQLYQMIDKGLQTVTLDDCIGWQCHCGLY